MKLPKRNSIEQVYLVISHPKVVITFTTLTLLTLFFNPITTLLLDTAFLLQLERFSVKWYHKVIATVLIIYGILITIYKFKKFKPSDTSYFTTLLLSSLYLVISIFGITANTKFIHLSPFLNWVNCIVFVPLVSQTVLACCWKAQKIDESENKLSSDQPINNDDDDDYEYKSYAKNVASKIIGSQFNTSFAVGVHGKWGSGKTSFIELLRSKLKKEKPEIIHIDFTPWNSHSPQQIVQDFFNTLQKELGKYNRSLPNLLAQYANKLTEVKSNSYTDFFKSIANLFTTANSKSIGELHSRIETIIRGINKKIIIYIDDVDRLDNDEIVEVIRLIRNTANFPNTFFIVAYDRDYVIKALNKYSEHAPERFLEKIFQIEINLPKIEFLLIHESLFKKLKESFGNDIYEKEILELSTPYDERLLIDDWIMNKRDVNRLVNSLFINYSLLMHEVEFKDLIHIELIRIKYPSVYNLIGLDT